MNSEVHAESLRPSLKDRLQMHVGEPVSLCYQCGKCTAGCPLNEEMDIAPNQIIRMLQLEMPELEDKVLRSYSIWLCLTCETCYGRCPKEVDLPSMMDYLRSESIRLGKVNPKAKDILAFHRSFLSSIKHTGRLHEVGLIAEYKARTMHLLQDVALAPRMYIKGKLKILPHNIEGKDAIAKIFRKIEEEEGGNL